MSEYKPALLIPVYRHGKACRKMIDSISPWCIQHDIKIILVDDGNTAEERSILQQIESKYPSLIILLSMKKNGGKGAAFKAGILHAESLGFTHVLQIDADGQHDFGAAGLFFEQSEQNPEDLICGFPAYDETAPEHRKNGRKFANTWCSVVTWKKGIKDGLCGFRVYPVKKTARYLKTHFIDLRMGFDIEILVKLIWSGMNFKFFPVGVTYPSDGVSNFHLFRDNVRISWVFTRLCIGMIFRIPLLLWRTLRELVRG